MQIVDLLIKLNRAEEALIRAMIKMLSARSESAGMNHQIYKSYTSGGWGLTKAVHFS